MKLFYELDEKKYIVKKNVNLRKILSTLDNRYDIRDIQRYIDKLVSWYSIKFSDHYLELLFNNKKVDNTILEIMNLERLQKNYTSFEDELFQKNSSNDGIVILQKNLIVAAGWGLIYNKKTNPEYGFYRTVQLLQDFNAHFSWNLSATIYKSVLERNYSLNNPEIVCLLEKKRHEKKDTVTSEKKISVLKRILKRY